MAQAPQLNDSQLNLLAKIAANTGETQPKHGDGQHNLLFKIAQNTYASSGLAGSALQPSGDGYVLCQQGDDLAAKYAEAKAKSPSATNRVTLFIVPGTYSLSSELSIDTEYVDIVGLGAQFQSPAVIVTNNTLNVTANDVRVSGVSVGSQEFKISDNKPLQVFENCKGGNNSFAGNGGTASGTFVACIGGNDSFGGYDIEQSSTASFFDCVAGNESFGGNAGDYPSAKYISCRLTSGSFPTIYIPGRARFCLDDDYNIVNADGGYDSDADSYFTTAGVTDATAKEQLNLFVIGIKRLGLWNNVVCWPLRSAQNAGTGSTAYSLGGLGTYNGTLVNSPTWTADGMEFTDDSTDYIATGFTPPKEDHLFFSVIECNPQGTNFNTITSTRRDPATGGYTYSQNWSGTFRSILWAAPSVLENAGDTAITDGSFHAIAFSSDLESATKIADIYIDGGARDTASLAITQDDPAQLLLGNELSTNSRALGGALSFAAYFAIPYNTTTAQNTIDGMRNLIKKTLCQDLFLP